MFKTIRHDIPEPALSRLCRLHGILQGLESEEHISSGRIGELISARAHSVRKDISYLEKMGRKGSAYKVSELKELIEVKLGLNTQRRACVAGLNQFTSAVLNNINLLPGALYFVAGFDTNINRLETFRTDIPLYPAYEIDNVVKSKNIEIAVITLPGKSAGECAKSFIDAGIKGILNFSPEILTSGKDNVIVRNLDLAGEFRNLLASVNTAQNKKKLSAQKSGS